MTNHVSKRLHDLLVSKECDLPNPSIADVVMWLYEKHGIWISVDAPHKLLKSWYFEVYKINDEITSIEESLFTSPTEAYEAAIEYILNNLL